MAITGANGEIVAAATSGADDERQATSAATTRSDFAWRNALRWISDSMVTVSVSCKPPAIFPSWPSWGYSFGRGSQTIVIGTILCPEDDNSSSSSKKNKNKKVRVCFQENGGADPFLLLELPLGIRELLDACRITLECGRGGPHLLVGEHAWSVYCNGRRAGFGHRREATEADRRAVEAMRAVSAGAGFLPDTPMPTTGEGGCGGGGLRYMRGRFERVVGSADSEAYHLIDPAGGGQGSQELSFFFLRV